VTLAERLKAHQYATFFAGKWHLGSKGFWPTEQGFDINIAGSDSGSPKQGYFSPYKLENLSDGEAGEHLPERIAAETIKFIIQHRDQPFLAWVPFYDVHTPLQARPDLKKKYEDKRKRLNLETQWGIESPREVRLSQDDPVYAAMVEAMDTAAGKILQAIDDLHLREQTLVIFTSDNGGLSTNEGSPTSNQPLRGGKGWPYEGGIRVPLLMRCPGYTQAQQVIDLPVSGIDIVPTVLEFAKLKVDPATLDGHHLLHDLKAERTLYWHYPHYGNQGGAPCAILREGRWKLIEWMEDQRVELFDVNADISEKNDLSMTEPVIKKSLLDKLHSWQQQRNVKMPTANPNFDPNLPHGRSKKAPKKKKS
jgi:arylsulfatase A-like enzyme